MHPALRRALTSILVMFLLAPGVHGQTPPMAGDDEDNVPTAPPAASAAAALDARVLALRQQLDAARDGAERWRLHNEITTAYFRGARSAEALKSREETLEDNAVPTGRRSLVASGLAFSYAQLHDYPKSQRTVQRAKQLARDTRPDELETLPNEPSYAFLNAEAEIARRSTGRHDVALAKSRERADLAWANFNDATLSEKRRRAAANELLDNVQNYVRILVQNNRRDEALSYVTAIQQRIATRPDLRARPYQQASIQHALAIALSSHDDYDAALAAIDAAIAGYQRAGAQDQDLGLGMSRRMRLMVALAMGRIGDYQEDARLLELGRAGNAILASSVAPSEADSLILAARGAWSAASLRIEEVMASNLRRQGSESPFYKYQAALQLLYKLNDPATRVSDAEIERFVARLASADNDWVDTNYRGSYVEEGALAKILDYLIPADGQPPAPASAALAFRVAELLRTSSSQGALADGAARLAAADPKLRDLVEQEQVLRFEQATSRRAFATATERIERAARQGEQDERVQKRRAAEAAEKERTYAAHSARLIELRRQIASQFPIYRELISPKIPTAAAIGAALRSGEAYVNFYAGPYSGYAFLVQPGGGLQVRRIATTRADARQTIAALRALFDAGLPPERSDDAAGFDLAASHALFRAWVAPLQQALGSTRTVYIGAGGMLSNLPWNVLTTQPATSIEQAAWWVNQVTPVQMPSGSSLILARGQNPSKARSPFLAFADPSFNGQQAASDATPSLRKVHPRAVKPEAYRQPAFDYRSITPLPETLDEARAIGTALHADAASVLHGVQASRSRVLQQNLSDARVIAFATHGLLPGEVPGLLKAGLALSYEGQGLLDSVLTIDDIVGLRLDADWVVLSACNTGYASGAAGDAMSALLRGFFASGARSLLATQWAVESQSAKELTTRTFVALAQDPALSKAEALARSQRDMLAGKLGALYRHPYFWAPYFIAGDASR